jgi:4-amino-4-deoxy-L-arabinose transferase-like glycosyltransferase
MTKTMESRSQLRSDLLHLAIITGAALAIGVYLIVTCVLITPDGVFYIRRAQELARDPWVVAGRFPPGYPLLLLGAHTLVSPFVDSDSALVWVYSSQAVTLLCRLLALICLYYLGKLLTDARRSFWAVLILTFLPYPAQHGSVVLREWPFLLFVALGFWLLLWALGGRKWWGFGLVGWVAGLGSLIRPECAQLFVYAIVGLVVVWRVQKQMRLSQALAAAVALAVCFLIPTVPYVLASGTIVPHQLRPSQWNSPPIIASVGGESASDRPLEFNVTAGELVVLSAAVSDADRDTVTLSVVAVPLGSRPVYRFRVAASGDCFLTVSEDEKEAASRAPDVLDYDGIAFYAWAETDGPAGLMPVYRFWSSVRGRHLYTIDESQRKAVLDDAEADRWQSENVAFYAFAPGSQPPDAKPVYRLPAVSGAPYWTLEGSEGAIVWYAYGPTEVPAGLTIASEILRWRPNLDQVGEYQLNIIADDGRIQSCQLVRINVRSPREVSSAGHRRAIRAALMPAAPDVGLSKIWQALYEIGGAFAANLMYFLVVPLGLGLYRYLKDEAGPREKALTAAVIAVNLALMLTRYVGVDSAPPRRYCLVLVVLAIFHVPAGGWIMARWIKGVVDLAGRRVYRGLSERFWFYLLMALALGPMCLPKLLRPLSDDKRNYLQIAQWLSGNTTAEDVIAVPDHRISFYAERQELFYEEHADPRKADYIVVIAAEGHLESAPKDWREVYVSQPDKKRRFRLIVYRTPQADSR